MRLLTVLSLGAALLTWSAPMVMADCCGCPSSDVCADGTACVSGESCCGKGSCDIFCCDCDGGCRNSGEADGIWKPVQASLHDVEKAKDCKHNIDKFDLNKDGNISFLEWAFRDGFAPRGSMAALAERWLHYDVEDKGYLTLEEAYHRKA